MHDDDGDEDDADGVAAAAAAAVEVDAGLAAGFGVAYATVVVGFGMAAVVGVAALAAIGDLLGALNLFTIGALDDEDDREADEDEDEVDTPVASGALLFMPTVAVGLDLFILVDSTECDEMSRPHSRHTFFLNACATNDAHEFDDVVVAGVGFAAPTTGDEAGTDGIVADTTVGWETGTEVASFGDSATFGVSSCGVAIFGVSPTGFGASIGISLAFGSILGDGAGVEAVADGVEATDDATGDDATVTAAGGDDDVDDATP